MRWSIVMPLKAGVGMFWSIGAPCVKCGRSVTKGTPPSQ